MFGGGWEQARATVIASRQLDHKAVYSKGRGTLRRRQEYVLDVQPPGGGPVFRTTVTSPLDVNSMRDLAVGEIIPVLCRAKDTKVKFDTSDPALSYEAVKAAREERFGELANAAPGGGAAPGSAPGAASDAVSALAAVVQMKEVRAAAKADAATGAVAGGGAKAAATAGDDRLGQLEKLADLHDRGVLNDAQFEAEKSRILGGE